MMTRAFLIITLIIWTGLQATARPIRVLNWWDYTDEKIIKKIQKNNLDIQIIEYKSNEVALGMLSSKKNNIDVSIVSSTIIAPALEAGFIDKDTKAMHDLIQLRKSKMLTLFPDSDKCIPYQWSTTLYSYDSRIIINPPKILSDLTDLKAKKIKIGIVDDQYEIAIRLLLDDPSCKADPSEVLEKCSNLLSKNKYINRNDIISDVESNILKEKMSATYNWHGSTALVLKQAPWLNFAIAEKNPVIGVDYVCLLKKKRTAKQMADAIKLIDLLTDPESNHWNTQTSQYFSPYIGETSALHPKVSQIYDKIINSNSKPVIIKMPSNNSEAMRNLNQWWRSVRYEL